MAKLQVVKQFDPWTLGGVKPYSKDEFYTASKNSFDHGERLNIRMPGELISDLSYFVNLKVIKEYKTVHDAVRDCIHHRMYELREKMNSPEWDRLVEVEHRKLIFAAIEREMDDQNTEVEGIQDRLMKARQRGDNHAIEQILDYIDTEIDNFRDPYRSRLLGLAQSYKQ